MQEACQMRRRRRGCTGVQICSMVLLALAGSGEAFIPGIQKGVKSLASAPTDAVQTQGARGGVCVQGLMGGRGVEEKVLSQRDLIQLIGGRMNVVKEGEAGILDVLEPYMDTLSAPNCAVAVFALAQAARTPVAQKTVRSDARFQRVLDRAAILLRRSDDPSPSDGPLLKPRELSGLIHGLASLKVEPDMALYTALIREAEGALPVCTESDMSGLMLALAEFESHAVPTSFLRAYAAATLERLPRMAPRDLVQTLKGLAMVNHNPGLAWMEAWVEEAEVQMPAFDASSLAATIKALAVTRHNPGRAFLTLFLSTLRPRITDMTPYDVSITVNSLFHLSFLPPPSFFRPLTAHAITQLPQFSPREIACTANGFAGLGSTVFGKAFVEEFMAKCTWQVTGMSPRELAGVISALAILRAQPSGPFLDVFIREAGAQVAQFTPKDLHKILTALARFDRCRPPTAGSSASAARLATAKMLRAFVETAAKRQLETDLQDEEVVNLVEAMQVLGVEAPGPLLRAAERAVRNLQLEEAAFSAAQ